MSNMQRCERGHLYDTAASRRCPYCPIDGLDVGATRPNSRPQPEGEVAEPVRAAGAVGRADTQPKQGDARAPSARRPTKIFWGHVAPEAEGAPPREDSVMNPVVGWLVAIEGPRGVKGRDFRLFAEGNTIGRDNNNRVVIKDDAVGNDAHALLTYDPLSSDNAFYVERGGVHLIWRLNNVAPEGDLARFEREAILTVTRLNPYDVIQIGNTQLLFVPLCNREFSWQWGGGAQ
jgi:hypothetical protein